MSRHKFMRIIRGFLPEHAIHWEEKQILKTVAFGSGWRDYIYFTSTNDPGSYPLVHSYRCPCPSLQIWRRLWHNYGFPISPKWGRQLVSSIRAPPDIPPPMIYCGLGEWRVLCVCSERGGGGLVDLGIWACHTLHYDAQWQVLHGCI